MTSFCSGEPLRGELATPLDLFSSLLPLTGDFETLATLLSPDLDLEAPREGERESLLLLL